MYIRTDRPVQDQTDSGQPGRYGNMEKRVPSISIPIAITVLFTVLGDVRATPLPADQNYDEEALIPKDTVHYPYLFWLGRPFYQQDDDDGGDDTYYNLQPRRQSSTLSYANVGAGWGR